MVVGRIMKAAAKPADASWLWTLAYGYHEDRRPTHGYGQGGVRQGAGGGNERQVVERRSWKAQQARCSP